MIEQSIAKQYGILPSEQGLLKYIDWAKMVTGLMDDTPLGRVVSVRMERDREVIRKFTPAQKRIRSEWAQFCASRWQKTGAKDTAAAMAQLEEMIAGLFGGR